MIRTMGIPCATKNPRKLKQLRGILAPFNVVVSQLPEKPEPPTVEENGNSSQENAKQKALAYAKTYGIAVLSMDAGLYISGLSISEQPGTKVRRIRFDGTRANDEEMVSYYSDLIRRRCNGQTAGDWEFAVCIATPQGAHEETRICCACRLVGTPSEKVLEGYPLESLQIADLETRKYLSDMTEEEWGAYYSGEIGPQLYAFLEEAERKLKL